MVFEYGMSEVAPSRTMRADNYALSEETKRMRDSEQARLTDHAYEEAQRLLGKHRAPLDRLADALLEKETIDRDEFLAMMGDVRPSRLRGDRRHGPRRSSRADVATLAASGLVRRRADVARASACEAGVPGRADALDPPVAALERVPASSA